MNDNLSEIITHLATNNSKLTNLLTLAIEHLKEKSDKDFALAEQLEQGLLDLKQPESELLE